MLEKQQLTFIKTASVYSILIPERNCHALMSVTCFPVFPDYNAVISKFFNLHALKQAKVIMPQIIILVTNILYYQVGMILTENNRKKSALFVFWIFLINLYSNTIYTSANFLLLRTYEGKAVLANTIITGIILCCLQIYRGKSPLFL